MKESIYLTDNIKEARKEVSIRIDNILKIDDFDLSIEYLKAIHKYLFHDILIYSGCFRDYNLKKEEFILNNHSVNYTDYHSIETNLRYDFQEEKQINYQKLEPDKKIKRIANLTVKIWSTHPFNEGNTRTTSVFIQKYLKKLDFDVKDIYFKENSEYFRNALVKASYYNQYLKIHPDINPLIKFYQKLLYDESLELKKSDLIVKEVFNTNQESNDIKRKIKLKDKPKKTK